MAGQDTFQRQFESAMNAAAGFAIVLIEINGSHLRTEAEGGEEITAEEQLMSGGIVAAMAMCVTGQ